MFGQYDLDPLLDGLDLNQLTIEQQHKLRGSARSYRAANNRYNLAIDIDDRAGALTEAQHMSHYLAKVQDVLNNVLASQA